MLSNITGMSERGNPIVKLLTLLLAFEYIYR